MGRDQHSRSEDQDRQWRAPGCAQGKGRAGRDAGNVDQVLGKEGRRAHHYSGCG